jgi:hypothetical protein
VAGQKTRLWKLKTSSGRMVDKPYSISTGRGRMTTQESFEEPTEQSKKFNQPQLGQLDNRVHAEGRFISSIPLAS